MPPLRHLVGAVFNLLVLAGCGEGYAIDPACLNINGVTAQSKVELLEVVSSFLRREGFDDLGRYDAMISLIPQGPLPDKDKKEQLERLYRERTFLNDPRHLRIIWADYVNAQTSELAQLHYMASAERFVELCILEERPGGFSPSGLAFYRRFVASLQEKYGTSVIVAKEPPPTDEAQYWRITVENTILSVVAWAIALLLALIATGSLSVYVLKRLKLSSITKRIIFVVVNAWLVTPLPFQGGFIFVFPGPNLLAFPWTDWEFYSHVGRFAAVSFPCALLVCAAVSMRLFRDRAKGKHNDHDLETKPS